MNRHLHLPSLSRSSRTPPRWLLSLAAGAAGLALTAAVVRYQARQAELRHPPTGRFITVRGVRLHYRQYGESGEPLLLLHGNGATSEDFDVSGLATLAAERYRVYEFDRPGFGYSDRPSGTTWDSAAQAELIHEAMQMLGIERPVVLGHSWGTQVAMSLALQHPESVRALVLLSGYYFPSARLDVPVLSLPAIPVLGTLMRYTVSPLISRLLWQRIVKRMFSPAPVTPEFQQRFPMGLSLRPSQLRASAAESALMIPDAMRMEPHYGEMKVPTVVMAGAGDQLVSASRQSQRLHESLPNSELRLTEGAGHMIHHVAPRQVMEAIDSVARRETAAANA